MAISNDLFDDGRGDSPRFLTAYSPPRPSIETLDFEPMWKTDYIKCLSPTSWHDVEIEKAHEIKIQNLPSKLFKYRAVNDYSLDNFNADTIWVCSADKFNDPYDSAVTIATKNLLDDFMNLEDIDSLIQDHSIKEYLNDDEIATVKSSKTPMDSIAQFLLLKDTNLSAKERDLIQKAIKISRQRLLSDFVRSFSSFLQKGVKIASLTEDNHSMLMWSHYANNHTGFAIEYNFQSLSKNDIRLRLITPVIYSKKLFDAAPYILQQRKHGNFNNLFGVLAASYKSIEWRYEKEWRLIIPMGDWDDRNYPMPKPTGVYLGERISDDDKVKIIEIANRKEIPIYQTYLSRDRFRMLNEPLKI